MSVEISTDMNANMNANMSGSKIQVCGGCNAKIGSVQLNSILRNLPSAPHHPLLLTDFQSNDDACVFRIPKNLSDLTDNNSAETTADPSDDEMVVLQTVDFFPAPVAEPYYFGQIAAANALSDIYAMGGKPAFALNIVGFPADKDPEILQEILAGGQSKIIESGACIAGGHSIHDHQEKYGLCVTGFAPLKRIKHNNQISNNCRLFLSKPLGTGILCAAASSGLVAEAEYKTLIAGMTELNKYASELALSYNAQAMTDVTGFGFIGHLCEMLGYLEQNNDMSQLQSRAEIYGRKLPFYPGAERLAKEMLQTGGGTRNRQAFGKYCSFRHNSFVRESLLFDPQTSGGLLIALSEDQDYLAFLSEAEERGLNMTEIGKIFMEPGKIEII